MRITERMKIQRGRRHIFNGVPRQHINLHLDDNETYEIGRDAFGELFDESFRPWIQCAETIALDILWTLRIDGEHYDR